MNIYRDLVIGDSSDPNIDAVYVSKMSDVYAIVNRYHAKINLNKRYDKAGKVYVELSLEVDRKNHDNLRNAIDSLG